MDGLVDQQIAAAPAPEVPAEPSPAPEESRADFSAGFTPSPDEGGSVADAGAAPSDPNLASNLSRPQGAADQPPWTSIRDFAKQQGFRRAEQFQDDQAFVGDLLRRADQADRDDYFARLGKQLAPHAQQIQGYLQQRQAPARQAPDWQPPQYDRRWAHLMEHDPASGLIIGKQGANVPPEVVESANKYLAWQEKFAADPAAVLTPMVETRAREIAREEMARFNGAQEQRFATQQIMEANQSWLYQRGPDGNVVQDYRGQLQVTPVGAKYIQNVALLSQAGVKDARTADMIARQMLSGEAQPQPQSPQTQQQFGAPSRNPTQAAPPSQRQNSPANTPTPSAGRSLGDLLRANLAAEGIRDADLADPQMSLSR